MLTSSVNGFFISLITCFFGVQPGSMSTEPVGLRWHTDPATAQREAESSNMDLLVCFTGTSWCGPCQVLEHDVFERADFRAIDQRFVLLKLDYPSLDENLPPVVRNTYLDWRERYSVEVSPTLFLLDRNARPYALVEDLSTRPDRAVADLVALQSIRMRRDDRFARSGAGNAQAAVLLDETLTELTTTLEARGKNLGRSRVARFYAPEVDQLLSSTTDHSLKAKYQALLSDNPGADPVRSMVDKIRAIRASEGNATALKFVNENLATPHSTALKKVLFNWKHTLLDWSEQHEAAYEVAKQMAVWDAYTIEENLLIRRSMFRSLIFLGRADESLDVLAKILAELPADSPAAYPFLKTEAHLLMSVGRNSDAHRLWETAHRLVTPGTSNWIDVQVFRARSLAGLKQYLSATKILQDARQQPDLLPLDRAHLFAEEAMIHKKSGDQATASKVATQGEELYQTLLDNQSAESLAYLRQKLDVAKKP